MKIIYSSLATIFCFLTLMSCASNPSLQKYYIDNSDNDNFVTMDIPRNLFKLKDDAPADLVKTLETIDKLNILAFVKDEGNEAAYLLENKKVKEIMKNPKYQELIRVKHNGRNALLKYEGGEDDETLDEVVVYVNDKNMGFALVRVLGDNMRPADIMKLAEKMDVFDFRGTELDSLLNRVGTIVEN